MRISFRWLHDFVDIDVVSSQVEEVAQTLTGIGLAVESIEIQDDDWALDAEVPSNRPDCLSHLGVARELAAFYGLKLRRPDFEAPPESFPAQHYPAAVEIVDPELCPRYAARVLTDLRVSESPDWLKRRLEVVGLRPINNVVDITNYVLMEVGHPLHAFDYEKLAGGRIVVRRAADQETLVMLDGTEQFLDASMLAICDDERPTAVAGVMGGSDSEITRESRTMLLESAYFLPSSVRSTAQKLRISTEASYRFERGADPEMPARALHRACRLLEEIAGARCVGPVMDVHPVPVKRRRVRLEHGRIRQVCGIETDPAFVRKTLTALEFDVGVEGPPWEVQVPGFRPDVELEDDLVEEVLRHYGYDRIESSYPQPAATGSRLETDEHERRVTRTLAAWGFCEAVNLVFTVPEKEEFFWDEVPEMVPLANPLSNEETHLRRSLIPGLVKSVRHNLNHGSQDVRLFEIGHVYHPGDPVLEEARLGFVATGDWYVPFWGSEADAFRFYHLKGMLQALFSAFGETMEVSSSPAVGLLQEGIAASVLLKGSEVGFIGQLHPRIQQFFKFRKPVLVGEIRLEPIYSMPLSVPCYQALDRFPSTERDLSFVVDKRTEFATIENGIKALNIPDLRDIQLVDFYQGPELSHGKVGLTVRLTFASPERTLTQEEVSRCGEEVLAALQSGVGAELRS